jgi:hypothetical protein
VGRSKGKHAGHSSRFTPFFTEKRRNIFEDTTRRFRLEDEDNRAGHGHLRITDQRRNQHVGRALGLVAARESVRQYLIKESQSPPPMPSDPTPVTPVKLRVVKQEKEQQPLTATVAEHVASRTVTGATAPPPARTQQRSAAATPIALPGKISAQLNLRHVIEACQRATDADGFFRLTDKELAKEAGVAVSTIRRHLELLIQASYLVRIPMRDGNRAAPSGFGWNNPVDELLAQLPEDAAPARTPSRRRAHVRHEEDTPERVAAAMRPKDVTVDAAGMQENAGAVMAGQALARLTGVEERIVALEEGRQIHADGINKLREDVKTIADYLRRTFGAQLGGK